MALSLVAAVTGHNASYVSHTNKILSKRRHQDNAYGSSCAPYHHPLLAPWITYMKYPWVVLHCNLSLLLHCIHRPDPSKVNSRTFWELLHGVQNSAARTARRQPPDGPAHVCCVQSKTSTTERLGYYNFDAISVAHSILSTPVP